MQHPLIHTLGDGQVDVTGAGIKSDFTGVRVGALTGARVGDFRGAAVGGFLGAAVGDFTGAAVGGLALHGVPSALDISMTNVSSKHFLSQT